MGVVVVVLAGLGMLGVGGYGISEGKAGEGGLEERKNMGFRAVGNRRVLVLDRMENE